MAQHVVAETSSPAETVPSDWLILVRDLLETVPGLPNWITWLLALVALITIVRSVWRFTADRLASLNQATAKMRAEDIAIRYIKMVRLRGDVPGLLARLSISIALLIIGTVIMISTIQIRLLFASTSVADLSLGQLIVWNLYGLTASLFLVLGSIGIVINAFPFVSFDRYIVKTRTRIEHLLQLAGHTEAEAHQLTNDMLAPRQTDEDDTP